jgi:antitoxin MazE
MKTKIVAIGNSRGIRIPQTLLQQCQLEDSVDLEVRNGELVIRSPIKPRAGWEQAFRDMTTRGEDRLLDPDLAAGSDWERTEWTW